MSTNVSEQKRKDLTDKIKKIHKYIATAKQDENTRQFLVWLSEIEKEIETKKFGLVFEEHREAIDDTLETHIPVLTENKKMFIDKGGQVNFLIEGDNLAALQLLLKTHKGKIDIIYIDPPYNNGDSDFIYNDKRVAATDTFKHSKWLSFITARLIIAHKLLSKHGIIFISINDKELYSLKVACDNIFGEDNFIANLVWANREGGGSSDSKLFRIKHEYILCFSREKEQVEIRGIGVTNEERYKQQDEYIEIRGKYYLQKLGMGSIQYSSSLDYPIICPDGTKVMPTDNNSGKKACWR